MIELMNQGPVGFAATGDVGARLLAANMDVNVLRPYVGRDGRHYVNQAVYDPKQQKLVNVARPLSNAVGTLRRDEWMAIDDQVIRAATTRLRLVSDLRGAGLEYRVNGMSRTVLETTTMTRTGKATLSMDPARMSEGDRPEYTPAYLPLPICHADFYFNLREIAVSRNGSQPLDTTCVEDAGIAVAEELEQLTLGSLPSFTYGGGSVYGALNFPSRGSQVLTNPAVNGWIPSVLVQEILEMRLTMFNNKRYGPWVIYVSPNWQTALDTDYSDKKGDNTLRDRILAIDGINDVRQLDFLTGLQMIMIQMTSNNVRMVVGLDLTTIQWDTIGGMRQNFKVMALVVPQWRVDADGHSGVVVGVAT